MRPFNLRLVKQPASDAPWSWRLAILCRSSGTGYSIVCKWLNTTNRTILRIMMHYAGSRRGGALEGAMQKFYQREEMEILADSVRRGIASGLFRAVDPLALARYVSVHLDGITAASMVRRKFDVVAAFRDLEASIWLQLDYRPRNNPLEKKGPTGQPTRATRLSIGR